MFASCVSPDICSSYHVVSLGMFRCLSPVSTNKQTQGKLFKYIRQPKIIYTREADVCLNIELATQLLYCRLYYIIALPPSNPQSIKQLPSRGEYHHFFSCLYTPSPPALNWVPQLRKHENGILEISIFPIPRHLRCHRLRRVPISGECQESNFVPASSQLPIHYWHWPTPRNIYHPESSDRDGSPLAE